jgi:hypothetical protein
VLPATFDQQPIAEPSKAKNTDYAATSPWSSISKRSPTSRIQTDGHRQSGSST